MDKFSDRLKKAMSAAGMKAIELHEKTGISKSTISEYLSGGYEPKQKNIYKLAKALNVKPSYLMGLTDEPTATSAPLPPADEETKPGYYIDEETARIANEMKENPGRRVLFDAARKLSPESIKEVQNYIEYLYQKQDGSDD